MSCYCRSLFAALFGNIVGALFVALPAIYMHLGDYDVTASLNRSEEGRLSERQSIGSSMSDHGGAKRDA